MTASCLCAQLQVERASSCSSMEENTSVGIKQNQQKQDAARLRPIVKAFLKSQQREEISSLLPSFTTVELPRKYSRLSAEKVIATYQHILEVAERVFSALSKEERIFLNKASVPMIAEKPDLFLTLLQNATFHALGSFRQGDGAHKGSLIERGFFLKKLFSSNLPIPLPTALLLSEKNLICVPKEIEKCSSVKVLDVSKNGLFAIPKEIGQLHGLTQLNLSGNNLKELPSEIAQMSSLEILDLANNPLEAFPSWLQGLSFLKAIRFDKKQCDRFSEAIKTFNEKRKSCQIEVQMEKGECKLWPC